MTQFEPLKVDFTPAYFIMFIAFVVMCLCGFAFGGWIWSKIKELAPSKVETGEDW